MPCQPTVSTASQPEPKTTLTVKIPTKHKIFSKFGHWEEGCFVEVGEVVVGEKRETEQIFGVGERRGGEWKGRIVVKIGGCEDTFVKGKRKLSVGKGTRERVLVDK
ncbi:hypothetical protein Pmani_038350 [Petrolisthes manimaculis]|uniref:Uncharacterized protein n=1 Tax=Petrolisthes manimaculis TaxID=1843537 RepID=A0AAE1NFW6_9EUCA|nr:hypothetical protein Pmani_038350 [Petrolisthes manimaculis]